MKINKKDKKEISKEYKDIDEESEKESKSDEESEKEAFTFSFRSEWMLGLFFNKLLCKTNKTEHKNLTSQYVEIVSPPPEI